MTVTLDGHARELVDTAAFMWITTVRADGLPQPTPVWFIWDHDTILIYSQTKAQKLKNIEANPKVALSFCNDAKGEDFIVLLGEARLEREAAPLTVIAAYLEKYKTDIARIGTTPEQMAVDYPVAIRVTPTRIRAEA